MYIITSKLEQNFDPSTQKKRVGSKTITNTNAVKERHPPPNCCLQQRGEEKELDSRENLRDK